MFKIDCHINSGNLKKKKYNRANSTAFRWIKRVIYDCSGHHGMAHHVLCVCENASEFLIKQEMAERGKGGEMKWH